MHITLTQIVAWIATYKYWLLLPIAIAEGPIISIIGGFLASIGQLNLWIAYAVLVAGDVIGDTLYYWIGHKSGKHLVPRFGHMFGLTRERVQLVESYFHKNTKKTLFLGKFTHAFGAAVLLTAGMVSVDFWEFLWVEIVGTAIKSFALVMIGYYFGQAYNKIDHYINQSVLIIIIVGVILVGGYLVVSHITNSYFKK